ncbi:MAG: hypothetical protein WBC44_16670 [Planctomycetaceae bacterium]
MLSNETIESYRRMTVAERADIVLAMIRDNAPALLHGPPDVVDRRFELLRRQNDERNRWMREGMARTGRCDG